MSVYNTKGAPDGGTLTCALTVIVKAPSAALRDPSLTDMTMLESLPTFALFGVPLNSPVVGENDAQLGWFLIENVSVSPVGPAVGVNLYGLPAMTEVAGEPLIVGASFCGGVLGGALFDPPPPQPDITVAANAISA
jgi:hypothetical protein